LYKPSATVPPQHNYITLFKKKKGFLREYTLIKVGCCGYPTSMEKYYEKFQLVEINRTFYKYPKITTVTGWREKAPINFEFTVKAHQDISHKFRFELEPSVKAFKRMVKICKTLKAQILLIQTPGSLRPDKLNKAEKFFEKAKREDLCMVWETRGPAWEKQNVKEKLVKTLQRLNVPHVTDPFVAMPAYTSDIAYFRLHGLGKRLYYYQYTDKELRKLYETIKPLNTKDKVVYVLFNNLAMFDDAIRFMHYLKTGSFLSLTGAIGLESVKIVIQKTRYPITKSLLLKKLGWRLVELEKYKQIRLEELLRNLPSKSYADANEVLQELKRQL
jgi:uncharacterized protein YecE (DUF72 family)